LEEHAATVSLGRPVALPDGTGTSAERPALTDHQVLPASFADDGAPRLIFRAKAAETAKPMPVGPLGDSGEPALDQPKNRESTTTEQLGQPRLLPQSPEPAVTPVVPDNCGCVESEPGCCVPGLARLRAGLLDHPLWQKLFACNECCSQPYHVWGSAEYLLWDIRSSSAPALVTTSPTGTRQSLAGVLGVPTTSVVFGGSELNQDTRSGLRFTLGFWCDNEQTYGWEGSYFFLGSQGDQFGASSGGSPILARPFYDIVAGHQNAELVAFPGVLAGGVGISTSTRLWGAEVNMRNNLLRGCCWRLDGLLGFRFLELDDNLRVMESLVVPSGTPLAGSSILVNDNFGTRNSFYGGQLGLDFEFRRACWSLNLTGKVALGSMHEVVNINGDTLFSIPGMASVASTGGLLTQPTNIGHYDRDHFTVIPEIGIKLGYQLTPHARVFVGYSLLYASDVVRSGNQIDTVVNTTQLPSQLGPGTLVGPARPAFQFRPNEFWAQGVNLGLEFRY
jgi:hypothetical protein